MLTPQTPLYRTVPPWPADQLGKPTEGKLPYYTFQPRLADHGLLSMDNGHLATPQRCLELSNQNSKQNQARQVAKVTVQQTETLRIPVVNDSLPERSSHILLNLSGSDQRKTSQALRCFAEQNHIIMPSRNAKTVRLLTKQSRHATLRETT